MTDESSFVLLSGGCDSPILLVSALVMAEVYPDLEPPFLTYAKGLGVLVIGAAVLGTQEVKTPDHQYHVFLSFFFTKQQFY